jgi:hypothetical protein
MTNNLTSTIDRIGVLNTQIAQIEAELKGLKDTMIEVGSGRYLGDVYQITVTEPSTREGHDAVMKAKIEELLAAHTSVQFRTAHTTLTQVKPSVRVSVRKDVSVAA